jgi:hypothetical protein
MKSSEIRNTGIVAIWHSEKAMRRYKKDTAVCFPPSSGSYNPTKRYDPWNTTAKHNPKVEDWSVKLRRIGGNDKLKMSELNHKRKVEAKYRQMVASAVNQNEAGEVVHV